MSELLELCRSDDLSFDALQEKIKALGPQLSSQDPSCFHEACRNKKVTLEIIQLLHNMWPEALRLRDDGRLPIHRLCANKNLDETNSIDILQFMLEIDTSLSVEASNDDDFLPVHYAFQYKSTGFCKILIDVFPESLRIGSLDFWLPIHQACEYGDREDTPDTIQYMLEMDPEIINAEDNYGGHDLPIHWAAMYGGTKLIEFILKYDPDAASKVDNDQSLPLHHACQYDENLSSIQYNWNDYTNNTNLSSIQVLYDAYPDAILARGEYGGTPLVIARSNRNQPAVDFIQTQLVYVRQAQDMTAMTTLDENGRLPLHCALKDNITLGSIKLLARAYPAAVQVADRNGVYPVHVACEFSSVKVVKYLVELVEDTLDRVDANNNSLLHYACRGGNLGVVKYLLEANVPSVSERNNNNKLAIQLLFDCGEEILDRDSIEYVETVWQLLLANPEVIRDFMP